uniref:Uncharacterized protein n=1 Tax=Romanomermis culicivorax TaxID=13658 RepID=A0A915KIB2_ROMCU
MQLIENCNKNMDLYVKHCTKIGEGGARKMMRRQKRDITALADPTGVDFAKICAEYRPKAQRYCKGRLTGTLKSNL